MDERKLRKHIFSGKKTERIIFAVTPEMKSAIETVADDECMSMSALLPSTALTKIMAHRDLFEGEGE
ncbi:MAG: hypothetical protein ACOYIK_06245 [Coriobacteriales bacterium]|jgi:hypothetical protein